MTAGFSDVPRYTADDYALWPGDWELWDGVAIAMSPSPFGPHQRIVTRLAHRLMIAIENARCDADVVVKLDWIVREDTIVRPDVMVVCGDFPEKHLVHPPGLVAEVLSSSTRQNDLGFKRRLYAEQGVGSYLIVDPETKTIEAFALQPGGSYSATGVGETQAVKPCHGCEIEINTTEVFGT